MRSITPQDALESVLLKFLRHDVSSLAVAGDDQVWPLVTRAGMIWRVQGVARQTALTGQRSQRVAAI
jgi:hypothetical protein